MRVERKDIPGIIEKDRMSPGNVRRLLEKVYGDYLPTACRINERDAAAETLGRQNMEFCTI